MKLWEFPQAKVIKGDLKLASYRVEIKWFQAEEMECAKLLRQKGAQGIWMQRSLRWLEPSARARAGHAALVAALGCFPKNNRRPLKGFRQSGAMIGRVVWEDHPERLEQGWGRGSEEMVWRLLQKGGAMMVTHGTTAVTGNRGYLQEVFKRQTDNLGYEGGKGGVQNYH